MKEDLPGLPGLVTITIAATGAGITWIAQGAWLPAVAGGAGIAAGWWAVNRINKK